MGENIDPTWVCFRSEAEPGHGWFDQRLEAVRRHYAQLVDYPLSIQRAQAGQVGVASIGDADPACRWPHFAEDERLAISTAYVPTGWDRITGPKPLAEAPARPRARLEQGAGRREPHVERARGDRRASTSMPAA